MFQIHYDSAHVAFRTSILKLGQAIGGYTKFDTKKCVRVTEHRQNEYVCMLLFSPFSPLSSLLRELTFQMPACPTTYTTDKNGSRTGEKRKTKKEERETES